VENLPRASPCGGGNQSGDCCAPSLKKGVPPPDAASLVRSRYTAYALLREDYLLATWHPSTRPAMLGLAGAAPAKWSGLEVKRRERQDADQAIVEFVARCKVNGRACRLHEVSRFVRRAGQWLYVDAA